MTCHSSYGTVTCRPAILHDDLLLGDFMGEKNRVLCGRRTYGLEVVTDTEPFCFRILLVRVRTLLVALVVVVSLDLFRCCTDI